MNDCRERIKEIFSELDKIKKELDQLPLGKEGYIDQTNYKLLLKFKPQYEKLLKILDESKNIAHCQVFAIKPDDEVGCVYQSPLEPLILADYAKLPTEDEKYTIIDKIRYYAKSGRIDKIKGIIDDVHYRLKAVIDGLESCPIDFDESESEQPSGEG